MMGGFEPLGEEAEKVLSALLERDSSKGMLVIECGMESPELRTLAKRGFIEDYECDYTQEAYGRLSDSARSYFDDKRKWRREAKINAVERVIRHIPGLH